MARVIRSILLFLLVFLSSASVAVEVIVYVDGIPLYTIGVTEEEPKHVWVKGSGRRFDLPMPIYAGATSIEAHIFAHKWRHDSLFVYYPRKQRLVEIGFPSGHSFEFDRFFEFLCLDEVPAVIPEEAGLLFGLLISGKVLHDFVLQGDEEEECRFACAEEVRMGESLEVDKSTFVTVRSRDNSIEVSAESQAHDFNIVDYLVKLEIYKIHKNGEDEDNGGYLGHIGKMFHYGLQWIGVEESKEKPIELLSAFMRGYCEPMDQDSEVGDLMDLNVEASEPMDQSKDTDEQPPAAKRTKMERQSLPKTVNQLIGVEFAVFPLPPPPPEQLPPIPEKFDQNKTFLSCFSESAKEALKECGKLNKSSLLELALTSSPQSGAK